MVFRRKERDFKRRALGVFVTGMMFLAGGMGLLWTARNQTGFAEWYSQNVYSVLVGSVGRVFGMIPVSASELFLYLLLAGMVWQGIRHRKRLLYLACGYFMCASALLFLYAANCGVNYYRKPFSAWFFTGVKQSAGADSGELLRMCEWLTGNVNEAWERMEADSGSYHGMQGKGREAMMRLAKEQPVLAGFYPRPKPVMVSWILSVQQCSGVYAPFTVEANYNRDMVAYNIPHTICHELSHLRGFMREDEANFIGYLACLESDSADYNYSGYLLGWIYAGNALAKENFEEYARLHGKLKEEVRRDLAANHQFWDQYEGKAAEAATHLNDTYLKANGQSEGVKTYGRVVDLMLYDFLENRMDSACN